MTTSEIEELLAALQARTAARPSYLYGDEGSKLVNPDGLKAIVLLNALLADRKALLEALEFYAREWEQDVDAEQTAHGWVATGAIGPLEPTPALIEDAGQKARQALSPDEGAPK